MNKSEIFYEQRLLKRWLSQIKDYRIQNVVKPVKVSVSEQFKSEKIESQPSDEHFKQISLPYDYGDIDTYMWIIGEFSNLDENTKYYGHFDFGTGAAGLTVGAESLLYINGNEHAGVDLNHRHVRLGKLAQKQQLVFRTWSGIADQTRLAELEYIQGQKAFGYHQIKTFELYELDEKVNNLYYNLFVMLDSYAVLKTNQSAIASRLISDLAKIFLKYDEADINLQLLYKLNDELETVIANYSKTSLVQMIAVGQTHIDIAWLWRVKHTREKAARSFATMLNLMETNDEYRFLQSQPQLFEFLKIDYPNIYKRIKAAVCAGKLDVEGAMWLEADCNIPSGESLIRQILYGKKFIKEEFNTDSKLLWMPDVFGYSWAMPQILKKCGVEVFCTTKMQWNQYNRMPFNTFKWCGIDGSEITTHLIEDFNFFTINGKSLISGWEQYKDKDLTDEILYQYGFGDGGGGPRQEDIELIKRYDKIPGMPNIKYDNPSNYFKRLNERVETAKSYVHRWDGELYLELHRGTFTSQAKIKKYNRQLEFQLRQLEMEIVKGKMNNLMVDNYQLKIEQIWKKLLLNQFHDIIPGSSINAVNNDALEQYAQISDDIKALEAKLYSQYPQTSDSFVVFNSFHRPLNDVITYRSSQQLAFYVNDERLKSVYENGEYKIVVDNLKPLAYTKISLKQTNNQYQNNAMPDQTEITNTIFSTTYYDIKFNKLGQITYLYDKALKRNVIVKGKVLNELVSYEDKPLDWDAWDIDIFYKNRKRVVDDIKSARIVSKNDIETKLEFTFNHFESKIKQIITLSNVTPRIDITHQVDWKNAHRLLRVLFATGIRATNARYDIQAGNVLRPTHRNTSWDFQKFEVLAHKWADLSTSSYGISILNDCKYGYSCDQDVLGLSLIKAAQFPDAKQDITNHQYTYSIYVHSGDVLSSNIEAEAFKLNNQYKLHRIGVNDQSIINLKNDNIIVDAIKMGENNNDTVVRFHECKNTDQGFELEADYCELDLLENEIPASGHLKPYEIKTIKLK